jgi:hypothetical protein
VLKSTVAVPGCPVARAQASNVLTAGITDGTIIATIMTVQVAMKTLRPIDIDAAIPIGLRADIIDVPVSTPMRMSGTASRALSSQALPANPRRIAAKALLAGSGVRSR